MKEWTPKEMHWGNGAPPWRRHRRWFFWRFAVAFGSMLLLAVGVTALLARLFTTIFGAGGEVTLLATVGTCSLFMALPILAMGVGWSLFQRVATPVAQVMAVTEAVAEGDLSARVETTTNGRFGRLAQSVNNMVAELERTYRQRRQLTADIAHELRTPLHIIQGNLEGILDGVYEADAAHIQNTLEETQLLARLVEDLSTLSLAESGELPLIRESVMIDELVTDVQTSFSGQAESAGVTLTARLAPGAPLVVDGDIQRLDQVLGNLVANAVRHTPAGGTITLGAARADDDIVLTVADTGEGIAEADLPFIFERFWRGDRARTHTAGSGGGLGLAIAEQLVRAHGGAITVESGPGVGTTFTIRLPAAI